MILVLFTGDRDGITLGTFVFFRHSGIGYASVANISQLAEKGWGAYGGGKPSIEVQNNGSTDVQIWLRNDLDASVGFDVYMIGKIF